jgi:hypothetical protein
VSVLWRLKSTLRVLLADASIITGGRDARHQPFHRSRRVRMSIHEGATPITVVVIPAFYRSHAAEDCFPEKKRSVTGRTAQFWSRRIEHAHYADRSSWHNASSFKAFPRQCRFVHGETLSDALPNTLVRSVDARNNKFNNFYCISGLMRRPL